MADEATNTGISKSQMFGKSYNNVGDTQANLCLCTKGDVKIKMGGKYINLLKDGKINAEGSNGGFYTVDSMDGVTKDGIYLMNNTSTNEDGEETTSESIYAVIGGEQFLVTTSEGGGFVSFEAAQQLTQEQVMQALSNVGLYFQTMDDAIAAGITDGLVYIIEENQLYRVVAGQYFKALGDVVTDDVTGQTSVVTEVPEHTHYWTEFQFGNILVNGTNSTGYITGTNDLTIDSGGTTIINGSSQVQIQASGATQLAFSGNTITLRSETMLMGQGASRSGSVQENDSSDDDSDDEGISGKGFMVYTDQTTGYQIVEADYVIAHVGTESGERYISAVNTPTKGSDDQPDFITISASKSTSNNITSLNITYTVDADKLNTWLQGQGYVMITTGTSGFTTAGGNISGYIGNWVSNNTSTFNSIIKNYLDDNGYKPASE